MRRRERGRHPAPARVWGAVGSQDAAETTRNGRSTGRRGLDSPVVASSLTVASGLCVAHLFWHVGGDTDRDAAVEAIEKAGAEGDQVVCVAIVGHKADVCTMILSADLWRIRDLQSRLRDAGLSLESSYFSITEVSEYAAGVPEELKQARLYPRLPPAGLPAWCFYPMSKRRNPGQNWYRLPYEERERMMYEHGATGRKFKGRVLQLVTGSTGVDDWEWGVTLFAKTPDDLKAVVYTMRFDEVSAEYAEFGPFWTGAVAEPTEVFDRVLPGR
ncbi:MAG: putative heme-dependent peroxidase [Acidimicrobiales bacterium]|nr:MAG: putative heme-dependent peroxidase [Acidimicrobiales bacterium]